MPMNSSDYYQSKRAEIREKQRQYYLKNRAVIYARQKKNRDWARTVYDTMVARCYLSTHKSFNRYGGAGVRICQQWLDSYAEFKEWLLANGWKRGLHVHRLNDCGNYSPENCQVVTPAENVRASRATKLDWEKVVEIRRLALEGMSAPEIAKVFGISPSHTSNVISNKRSWVG